MGFGSAICKSAGAPKSNVRKFAKFMLAMQVQKLSQSPASPLAATGQGRLGFDLWANLTLFWAPGSG